MRTDIAILKGYFLPVLEELTSNDSEFNKSLQLESFWDYFNQIVLDLKETEEFIKQFNIVNINHYNEIFSTLRNEYISELAFEYSIGNTNPAIELLIKYNNAKFNEEVSYHKDLNIAISLLEQEKLKKYIKNIELEDEFSINDDEIESAFVLLQNKTENESLKEKIKSWNLTNEPIESEFVYADELDGNLYNPGNKNISMQLNRGQKNKFHISSFLKYAIAASVLGIVFFLGQVYYKGIMSNKDNNFAANESSQASEALAADSLAAEPDNIRKHHTMRSVISSTASSLKVMQQTGIGFGPASNKQYKFVRLNLTQRLKELTKYRDSLIKNNNSQQIEIIKEIDSLKNLSNKYIFNKNKIEVYTDNPIEEYKLLSNEGLYYLKHNSDYYIISPCKTPHTLIKLNNPLTINILEKIAFDNE